MARLAQTRLLLLGVVAGALAGAALKGDAGAQQFLGAIPHGPAKCQAGWTLDPVRGDCIRCPPNYGPTFLPLDAAACGRSAAIGYSKATQYRRGTGLFGLNCPAGQFRDWDGFCYSCPQGYIRTATGIRDPAACAMPNLPAFRPATARVSACPPGAFRDIGRGDCWTCPKSIRTAAPVDSKTACTTSVTGILGVDPRGLCRDVLAALTEGGTALARLQKTVEDLVSPLMTPLHDGMRQLAGQVRTPAEFDQLLDGAGRHMRPYRTAFEGLSNLTERVSKSRDALDRLMLDPAIRCDGDAARLNRELAALGLAPSPRTSAPLFGEPAFNLIRRPGGASLDDSAAQITWPDFVVLADRFDIIMPSVVRIAFSLSTVGNFGDQSGTFFSVGLAVAPKEPSVGIEVSRSFLGFWNAEFSGFAGAGRIIPIGSLSAEISLTAGDQVTDFFGRLRRKASSSKPQGPSLLPLFIPDGISWSFDPVSIVEGPFVWGLGPNWTPIHLNLPPRKRAPTPTKLWVAPSASFDISWLVPNSR